MAGDYELLLQSPTGVNLGPLSKVAKCVYGRSQNAPGEMTLTVPDGYYDPSLFQYFSRILVQRQVGNGQPYIDFNTPFFIIDGPTYSLAADGTALLSFAATDALGLILPSRNIAYNEYNEYTQKLDYADDMLKAFVRENAGTLATDTDRDLSSWMGVDTDRSAAPQLYFDRASRRPLLDVLTDVANASANDPTTPTWLGFDVELADQLTGYLEFRTYTGQRGVDHRFPGGNPPLVLSVEAGNLANVETTVQFRQSASFIYAGGAGVGSIRAVATAQDDALIALSPFGRREMFVDGSQVVVAAALQTLADSELRNLRPRQSMTANLVETNGTLRGVQWDFGDYVTANYKSLTFDARVDKVLVTLEAASGGGLVDSTATYLRGEQAVAVE